MDWSIDGGVSPRPGESSPYSPSILLEEAGRRKGHLGERLHHSGLCCCKFVFLPSHFVGRRVFVSGLVFIYACPCTLNIMTCITPVVLKSGIDICKNSCVFWVIKLKQRFLATCAVLMLIKQTKN